MNNNTIRGVLLPLLFLILYSLPATAEKVKLTTNHGDIIIELNSEKSPITVENFLTYVDDGFYDGTVFHRVIKSFMIQAGGMTETLQQKSTYPPIKNEANNGLSNRRGTIAMGRTTAAHSANSHFFINTVNNTFLDHKDTTSGSRWGYCVFGEVIEGMEVVDAIEKVQTGSQSGMQDVPLSSVIIVSAKRVDKEAIVPSKNEELLPLITSCNKSVITVYSKSASVISILSPQGRILKGNIVLHRGNNTITVSDLPSGVYLYNLVYASGAVETARFVKP